MPNVYVILGESNSRKSSTVRALTGVPMQYDAWSVGTTAGVIDVYVQIQALQEAKIDAPAFVKKIADVDQFRISRGGSVINNLLLPLRVSAFNGFHDGADYLNHFMQAGWSIQQIVVLDATVPPVGLPVVVPTHLISGSASMPANAIASQIRGCWNWL